jgi:predicted transcriptional regulator
MDKKIIAVVFSFILFLALVSGAGAAGCSLVSGKAYYSDGVSFFSDSACRQERTAADLNVGAPAASTYISAGSGNCRQVSGKTYYSDGVSLFSDSACHQEMTNASLNASAPAASTYISAGSGNCRYDSLRQQFTDGVSFFVDNKCANEAFNGGTVSNVSAGLAAATAPASVADTSQLAQLTQRIDTLEKRMVGLQSILVQLLALLSKK